MQENINLFEKALTGKEGESHCSAAIREEGIWIDCDVDKKREPVKGNPEDLKRLFHRGTV